MEDNRVEKTRSFRDEDYSNRRAFLRSYPLQWQEKEEEEEENGYIESKKTGKSEAEEMTKQIIARLKSRFIAIVSWSEGKCVVLRRIKDKVAVYLVACHPFGFKSSSKLVTLR